MPADYPRPVTDHFLLQAVFNAHSLNVSNREAVHRDFEAPEFRVSTDELIRLALKGRYAVASTLVKADGQSTHFKDDAWPIPRDRVLQFSTALRYLASDDSDDVDFVGDAVNPAQVFRLVDAWALRERLFREDADLA